MSPSAIRTLSKQSDIAGRKMPCRLWKETFSLAEDYLCVCGAGAPLAPPPSEAAAAMRRMAQLLERQHKARFQSISQTFLKQCGPDLCSDLRKVMEEMVGDGHLNWGRVVSLFTFTGVVVRLLEEQKVAHPGLVLGQEAQLYRRLAETIADYLGEEKKDWLLENDGWEGFLKFSQVPSASLESSVKTALFAAAGFGLAGLTFLLVR